MLVLENGSVKMSKKNVVLGFLTKDKRNILKKPRVWTKSTKFSDAKGVSVMFSFAISMMDAISWQKGSIPEIHAHHSHEFLNVLFPSNRHLIVRFMTLNSLWRLCRSVISLLLCDTCGLESEFNLST